MILQTYTKSFCVAGGMLLLTISASLCLTGSSWGQALSGDSLTLDSAAPFHRIRDIAAAGEFYEISPDDVFLNFHTNRTRIDAEIQPPLRIPWNAQPGLMHIGFFGVAIGSNPPGSVAKAPLHVHSYGPDVDNSVARAKIVVEDADPESGVRTLIEMQNRGGARFAFTNTDTTRSWAFQNNASDGFLINLLGSGGNEFSIRKTGMVTMGPGGIQNFVLDTVGNLTILGTLNSASDRNLKQDFENVDEVEILSKVASLPITTWRYKKDQQGVRHIGPVSQDFYSAFQMGKSEKNISVTDAAGVAFASIKALNSKCNQLQSEVSQKQERIEELEAQLSEFNQRLSQLEALLPKPE